MTTAGPYRAMSRPATTKDMSGTMRGPGAMASPARSADQPHTSCSQRTMDKSMAPKAAEKKRATIDDPVNALDRKSDGLMSGLRLVRQWTTKSPIRTAAPVSDPMIAVEPQPHRSPRRSRR